MKQPCSLLTRFVSFLFFILAISSSAKADFVHMVKKGESLYHIGKKYGLSVEQLQEANELSSSKIKAGQYLTIPGKDAGAPVEKKEKWKKPGTTEGEFLELEIPETHTVKKGETLAKIAYRYHLWVKDLEEINQLHGKRVRPGQIIFLQRINKDQEERGEGKFGNAAKKDEKEEDAESRQREIKGRGFLVEERDRELLVRVAKSFLGLRYRRGGTSVNGMDCSFFVQKIFKIFGIDLPRTAREQCEVGYTVPRKVLRNGDLVFFKRGQARRPTHVGIYIGNNQFIHTSLSKGRVELGNLESRYFSTHFFGARRIEESAKQIEPEGAETAKATKGLDS